MWPIQADLLEDVTTEVINRRLSPDDPRQTNRHIHAGQNDALSNRLNSRAFRPALTNGESYRLRDSQRRIKRKRMEKTDN